MTHQKMIDGVLIDLTTQEQAERDAEAATWDAGENDRKAAQVRAERNTKLAATDWTQITDSTADKTAWATHRQALRDITAQTGFPWTITWPDAP